MKRKKTEWECWQHVNKSGRGASLPSSKHNLPSSSWLEPGINFPPCSRFPSAPEIGNIAHRRQKDTFCRKYNAEASYRDFFFYKGNTAHRYQNENLFLYSATFSKKCVVDVCVHACFVLCLCRFWFREHRFFFFFYLCCSVRLKFPASLNWTRSVNQCV